MSVENAGWRVPVVTTGANLAFAAALLAGIAGELVLLRRNEIRRNNLWGLASIGSLALAFAIWSTTKSGQLAVPARLARPGTRGLARARCPRRVVPLSLLRQETVETVETVEPMETAPGR